jgi:spore germination protein GerM
MQKRLHAVIGAAALCAVVLCGCTRKTSDTANNAPAPQTTVPPSAPAAPSGQTASKTPVKDSIEELLRTDALKEYPTFPKGTRLLGADLKDGVVTLDFSHDFNGLANMGESVESEAQKELRSALAKISGVDKMRVTVEGKPFESQATDWNTPFSVRDEQENALQQGASR